MIMPENNAEWQAEREMMIAQNEQRAQREILIFMLCKVMLVCTVTLAGLCIFLIATRS